MSEHKHEPKATICMNLTSSSGTWLRGCLQPQHYYVSLEVYDPDRKEIVRVGMSYEQAARMLLYNGDVECTLERYRNEKGEMVSEKIEPPESVHKRMKGRLDETQTAILKRIEDVRRDLYEAVNGDLKLGKGKVKELLQEVEVIQSHYRSNQNFVVRQAEEELEQMQSNAIGQIGVFLQTKGLDIPEDNLLKALLPTGTPKLLGSVEGVKDDYELKDRKQKSIDDMTALQVRDLMSKRLRQLEVEESKIEGNSERKHLFMCGVTEVRGGVSVRYINYQGSHTLDLDEAKSYLKFLMSITIKEFKTHWHYKE